MKENRFISKPMNSLAVTGTTDTRDNPPRAKSLVIYHFFENDKTYISNLAHFLQFGYSEDADYIIVVAGKFTVDFPVRPNIRYLATENRNNDFGGYCAAINALGDEVFTYDYFYFINSSVRGPYLPPYVDGDWKSIFRAKLTGDIGLVGSSINILQPASPHSLHYKAKYGGNEPFSHVQTMAYAMPRQSLAYLREAGFYSNVAELDKVSVITEYELRLSQLILRNGWNITALLPEYGALDYREHQPGINPPASRQSNGDPNYSNCYFGRNAHPFEVVFIKTNRGITIEAYLDRLAYSALCGRKTLPDWKDCKFVTEYVDTIKAVAHSVDTIWLGPDLTVEDILGFVDRMLQQVPDARNPVEEILKRHSAK